MCVEQLVQKYIDALPSQYRSDNPIPPSKNVEYWPVQFWVWDKHIIEIDTIDGSFGAWEHIDQAIDAAIVKLIDHVREVEDNPNIVPSHIGWKAFERVDDYEDDPGVFGEMEFVCTWN